LYRSVPLLFEGVKDWIFGQGQGTEWSKRQIEYEQK